MQMTWDYDRATLPAIPEYVERELLRRFDQGWLLMTTDEHGGTEMLAPTVTFVFRRSRAAGRKRRIPARRRATERNAR